MKYEKRRKVFINSLLNDSCRLHLDIDNDWLGLTSCRKPASLLESKMLLLLKRWRIRNFNMKSSEEKKQIKNFLCAVGAFRKAHFSLPPSSVIKLYELSLLLHFHASTKKERK